MALRAKVIESGNPAAIAALARGDAENAIIAATPGGIEAQEKRGQATLVASTDMPKELYPSREAFEKVGFTFGAPVDEIFLSATLPAGWTRAATGHSMHSDILDEQGRKRVSVFYKAAFYDRRADAYLTPRYTIETHYGDSPEGGAGLAADEQVVIVCDAKREIHRRPPTKQRNYDAHGIAMKEARAWLAGHFPDAQDPTAYW